MSLLISSTDWDDSIQKSLTNHSLVIGQRFSNCCGLNHHFITIIMHLIIEWPDSLASNSIRERDVANNYIRLRAGRENVHLPA